MASYKKNETTGKWDVQYRYIDHFGKSRKSTKRNFATKKEAEAWYASFSLMKKNDMNMYFSDFVKLYLEDASTRTKRNTFKSKEYMITSKLLPFFGQRKVNDITPAMVRMWQNSLIEQGFSQTYLKTINNQLSAIMNYAVNFYDLKENPCHKAGSLGKKQASEMKFWTKEQFFKFIDQVIDKQESYTAFKVFYWTGMRLGELLALTPEDIDFEKKTIRINKSYQRIDKEDVITSPKTEKSNRVITVPQFLLDDIQSYLDNLYHPKKENRLFRFSKNYLERELARGAKKADLEKIRIHDLRHPYVKHTTKIFSLRLKFFQAQSVLDALRKTRGAFLHLREGGTHNPFLRPCNKKLSSWSLPQSKMSLILYAISIRLSGYTSTLSMRRPVSSAVRPSELKTALAASCRLSRRACSSCFCFACANTTA